MSATPPARPPLSLASTHELDRDVDGPLAELRTGDWLDRQTFPPLRYAVPGIVPEGLTVLVGPPKVGKSWLTAGLCLGVAAGGRVLGALTVDDPRPVLVLALEDGHRRIQSRARKLLDDDPIPPLFTYVTRVPRGSTVPELVDAWCERYGSEGALVVVDTLGKVMPPALPGESAYARDYRVAGAIKRLADDRPGLAVVVVHHDRKAGGEDFVDAVSGTHGIAGAADTILVLGRPRAEGSGLLRVTGRDVVERDYAVELVDGVSWQLSGESLDAASQAAAALRATTGLGGDMAAVVAAVTREGMTAADVAKATTLDLDRVRDYLARAVAAGRLDRVTRGRYSPLTPYIPLSEVSEVSGREDVDTLLSDTHDTSDTPTRDASADSGWSW